MFLVQELTAQWQRSWRLRVAVTVVIVASALFVTRLCLGTRVMRASAEWLWAQQAPRHAVRCFD
jgi:hypothetical protein